MTNKFKVETSLSDIGTSYRFNQFHVFFGNKYSNREKIENRFNEFKFFRLKQVHGDRVVEAKSDIVEADAHWTDQLNLGLLIATADCGPIMILDPDDMKVCAIHAGWRGVENRITPKSIIQEFPKHPQNLVVFIGPHIQMPSFEIDNKFRDSLIKTVDPQLSSKSLSNFSKETKAGYSLVDLNAILLEQLKQCGVLSNNIYQLKVDTRTSNEYHSYRRDKENSGRQLSFVAIESGAK